MTREKIRWRPAAGPARRMPAAVALVLAITAALLLAVTPVVSAATAAPHRIDLRVLLLDDDSAWTDALENQMVTEGIPFDRVSLVAPRTTTITAASLATGDHARYQAVITPNAAAGGIGADELAALRAYEARFGIREVDAYTYPNPALGLATPTFAGDLGLAGITPTVTPAGQANGFSYLNGPVPYSTGSYTYLSEPLTATSNPAMPAGGSFTTLMSAAIPNSTATGSVIGVYSNAGVDQMIVTSAFNFFQPQFKTVAHGILTWATRGVHLGYNRNYMAFHIDDGFAPVATWNDQFKCTPGEDCPLNADGTSVPEAPVRMTADDVNYAVQWQAAHDYQLTIAFNGFYADTTDSLTQAFRASAKKFKWLNHGFEHIYQGCVQNFTVAPWQCTTDATGQVQWVSQPTIYNEIQQNIARGNALGLPFTASEYLSGEHSGLKQLPQQTEDNPNFGLAVTQARLATIGADASREAGSRQVGSAVTVPRHPTAIYYNAASVAQEISEYNWFYTTKANGGSGLCEPNPVTCITPLDANGFASHIVPRDADLNMSFILSNDPRPFYAHTSNLTQDRIVYPLLETILGRYRAAFAPSAPLVNSTLTEAGTALQRQATWATTGMSATPAASAYLENGRVTITNSGTGSVPVTMPTGTTIPGVNLESYGGEQSGWLPAKATTTATPPAATLTVTGSTNMVLGQPASVTYTASGVPAASIFLTGVLPTGLTVTPGVGTLTISGTPGPGTLGSYPITITSTSGSGRLTEAVTLNVMELPKITSAATAAATAGSAFNFVVTTTGTPAPAVTMAGALPAGVTFTPNADGTARLAGTPTEGGVFKVAFTATNPVGTATQDFTLTVAQAPAFTSGASTTGSTGTALSFPVTTTGWPRPALAASGTLPPGVSLTDNGDGTGQLSGTPTAVGTYTFTLTATNATGKTTQDFTLAVTQAPAFTSAAAASGQEGTALSFTVTATGSPKPALTVTGTLPLGVSFTDNGDGTARLAGTPTTNGTFPVTLTATNPVGTATQDFTLTVAPAPLPPGPPTPEGAGRFVPLSPTRVLDTRSGVGAPAVKPAAASTTTLTVTGGLVPADATAVALNLTVAEPDGAGYATVFPAGSGRPETSDVNVSEPGEVAANAAAVALGSGGRISIFTYSSAHLVADVTGYWLPAEKASDGRFTSIAPARLLDTRASGGITPGVPVSVPVLGHGGVPDHGVTAVAVTVTYTNVAAPGYVTVWPSGQPRPNASTTNPNGPGDIRSNLAFVPVGADGKVSVLTYAGADVVLDVVGWFTASDAPASNQGLFVAAPRERVLDTRLPGPPDRVGAGRTAAFDLGAEAPGAMAVLTNLTATNTVGGGYLTAYPTAGPRPLASTVNWSGANQSRAALAALTPQLEVFAYSDADVVMDLSGWFTG